MIAARLKHAAKDDVEVLAITAPERGVCAKDDAIVCVESKPEPVVVLQVFKVQIGATVGLFGVVEERAIEAAPDLPGYSPAQDPVRAAKRYSLHPRSVSLPPVSHEMNGITETDDIGARQRAAAITLRSCGSGDGRASASTRRRRPPCARRQNVKVHAYSRPSGISWNPIVHFCKDARPHEVAHLRQPGNLRRIELIVDVGNSIVPTLPHTRLQILDPTAGEDRTNRPYSDPSSKAVRTKRVVGLLLTLDSRADTEISLRGNLAGSPCLAPRVAAGRQRQRAGRPRYCLCWRAHSRLALSAQARDSRKPMP